MDKPVKIDEKWIADQEACCEGAAMVNAETLQKALGEIGRLRTLPYGVDWHNGYDEGRKAGIVESARTDESAGMKEAFEKLSTALLGLRHIHEQGARWFTRGESGAWQQAEVEFRRAAEARKEFSEALTKVRASKEAEIVVLPPCGHEDERAGNIIAHYQCRKCGAVSD